MNVPALLLGLLVLPWAGFAAEAPVLTPQQRLQPAQLRATEEAVRRFARERAEVPVIGVYEDFRAIIGKTRARAEPAGPPRYSGAGR